MWNFTQTSVNVKGWKKRLVVAAVDRAIASDRRIVALATPLTYAHIANRLPKNNAGRTPAEVTLGNISNVAN
jgi:hypothetical protein